MLIQSVSLVCETLEYEGKTLPAIGNQASQIMDKSKLQQLSEDLQQQALNIVSACHMELQNNPDLESIKTLAKITLDLRNAFFKDPSVVVNTGDTINNTQINNNNIAVFRDALRKEI